MHNFISFREPIYLSKQNMFFIEIFEIRDNNLKISALQKDSDELITFSFFFLKSVQNEILMVAQEFLRCFSDSCLTFSSEFIY